MPIALGWALLNLILAPQSVHFLVIPGLEGAIDATPWSCSATLPVLMLPLLSLSHISVD